MSSRILEQIFDSPAKVRLFKLFLRNPDEYYSLSEVATKTQADRRVVKKQIDTLEKVGFFRKKIVKKKSAKGATKKSNAKGKKKKPVSGEKKPGVYFSVSPRFVFYDELRSLILKSSPASLDKFSAQIKELGRIKLAVLSGVFVNNSNSRVDLFLVGDNVNFRKLSGFLRRVEAEVGRPINYSILTTKDFSYRYGMFDRFILDILEGQHKKVINKLRI